MSETDNDEISMAECGNCRAVIPSNSSECPECKIKFSGISEDALGECGACETLVPLESTSCSNCGVAFVADDIVDVLRNWLSNTGLSIAALFDKFDTNGDGMIDSEELRQGLLNLNLADLPPSQVERLIEEIDIDGNGEIDLMELEQSVTGGEYTPSVSKKEDVEVAEEEIQEENHDDDSDDSEETEEEVEEDDDD
ncbi:MAG: EF-hand domain-containing protein, partial [Candidatus Poseidoniaceae archaeon]